MTDDTLLPFDLPSVRRKKLTIDFDGGNQSSDGGLLLLREAERQLGVCRRLAEAMPDRRDPDRVRHAMFEMVMARASAIACGSRLILYFTPPSVSKHSTTDSGCSQFLNHLGHLETPFVEKFRLLFVGHVGPG